MRIPVANFLPSGEPGERRKFQFTDLDCNHNKYYRVETWPMPDGQVFFRATFGRVGTTPQTDEKIVAAAWVERKIQEKCRKGYQEITLHRPVIAACESADAGQVHPKVQQLVEYIYAEAGEKIASYLAVGLESLSQEQIERGRKYLQLAQSQYTNWKQSSSQAMFRLLASTIQSYYNTIPTQLPGRIDPEKVVLDYCQAFDEQEDRLNQLEAAIATRAVERSNPQVSQYDALGAELSCLPQTDSTFGRLIDKIEQTCVHGYRLTVREIYRVAIPAERRSFDSNERGRSRVELLFHGTANQNVRHILRSGLICPRSPSHGRMFGHGIYFANQCSKSSNYCSARLHQGPLILFLADVAVGRPFTARQAMGDLREAPTGYDSVLGKAGLTQALGGKLAFDEYVVYSASQQTLRYLVLFDR